MIRSLASRGGADFVSDHYFTTGALPRTTVTKWTPWMDLGAVPHRRVLRIDLSRFDFHSTGQKVHPSREQNIWSLCIGLVNAAQAAACGPGVSWIRQGGLPRRQRVWGAEHHQNLLVWRLTRLAQLQEAPRPNDFNDGQHEPAEEQAAKLNELVCLCQAVLADGEISLDEIKELIRWLRTNRNLQLPAVRSLIELMLRITADKVITSSEKAELKSAIEEMIGEGDQG